MSKSKFVYVTYIRTNADKLWDALTTSEFMKLYWFGMHQESDWCQGSPWAMVDSKGHVWDSGKIVEADRPRKIVISWRHEHHADMRAEGLSQMTYLIEPSDGSIKLTVIHECDVENSKVIAAVSGGWPMILASLKSYLETGEALERPVAK